MYKFLTAVDGGFKIQNTETDELTTLSTRKEIRRFLGLNSDDITPNFITEVLEGLSLDSSSINLFEDVLSVVVEEMEEMLSQNKLFNLLETKQNIFSVELFNNTVSLLDKSYATKFYKKHKNDLDKSYQVELVIRTKNNKIILEFLEKNPNISIEDKKSLLRTLPYENLLKIYNSNKFDIQNLLSVDEMLSIAGEKQKVNFIKNHFEKIPIDVLDKFTSGNDELKKIVLNVLEKNQNKLDSNQLLFLTYNSTTKKQEDYCKKYEDKFDDFQKYILTSTRDKNLIDKIINNLGWGSIINQTGQSLLMQTEATNFSEDTVYQLFKYCIYTDTMPDISKAISEQETFELFSEFRRLNIPQNMLDVINIRDTLEEFNKYHNLISDCMGEYLTEEEQLKLTTVLNDKYIPIESKEELQEYPQKRTEYIDKLSQEDLDSAIIYTITGLQKEEYFEKEGLYFKDIQLDQTMTDFSEELQEEITLMKIAKELILTIQSESLENKMKILGSFKKDLEKEFTSQGSHISKFRRNFRGFETHLRMLYGKELQESLSNSELPSPQKDKDVEIISLNGEDFKILVHGLNAYGNGANSYQHSDVGNAYICTSLISNKYIGRAKASIYYGFKNISSKSLALEGPRDIFSYAKKNSLDILAHKTEDVAFLKTDELIDRTHRNNYSEIVLFRDQVDEFGKVRPIQPDYIIAFGEISREDRAEARRLNIPIVTINEKAYEQQQEQTNEKEDVIVQTKEDIVEQQESTEKTQEELQSAERIKLRELMMGVIMQAKNNCTAIQQEAIMAEMQKEFKLAKQQEELQEAQQMEGLNV